MLRFLLGWSLATLLASVTVYATSRIDRAELPSAAAQRWAVSALAAARAGSPLREPPADAQRYRARDAVIVLAWVQGHVRARYVGSASFAESVKRAAAQFAADPSLSGL